MSIALVTGSAGLVGSAATRRFAAMGLEVVGIDNDMRRDFFGEEASTRSQRELLQHDLKGCYSHRDVDIRDEAAIGRIFAHYRRQIKLIVHAAAQPSHDWAATAPKIDFAVNAQGTLNLLEAARQHCPHAVFVFLSTNKVYGDRPNSLPLIEQPLRFELEPSHPYYAGIPEEMPIDGSLHSLFGVSKASADLLVQEYGRYFGMATACFRGGCLTGPHHAATRLHGFLGYLMRCCATETPYTVYGYHGKQVRDNIHCGDLVEAFVEFFHNPREAEVYNIGGGRFSNCSMLEAIELCEQITGKELRQTYSEANRRGDHIWWITDTGKFRRHYPDWTQRHDIESICREIYEAHLKRSRGTLNATGTPPAP